MDERLKYFKLAKEYNEKYKDIFKEAHIRGNQKSLSLISLKKGWAELGYSGLKTDKTILSKLQKITEKPKNINKPEKELQAWIIKNAIKNNHTLPCGDNIQFITSEMAVTKNKKRVVNDILGFKDGSLYVIELKSDRAMGRLIEQVENFKKIIEEEKKLFDDLCKLYNHNWDKESIIKVVVWPYNKNGKKSSIELLNEKIIEYGYKEKNDGFEFIKYEN